VFDPWWSRNITPGFDLYNDPGRLRGRSGVGPGREDGRGCVGRWKIWLDDGPNDAKVAQNMVMIMITAAVK
jgi:hypothetical protein